MILAGRFSFIMISCARQGEALDYIAIIMKTPITQGAKHSISGQPYLDF